MPFLGSKNSFSVEVYRKFMKVRLSKAYNAHFGIKNDDIG